jgi:3-methyladenine DNA glycosylase AlkD
MSNTPSKLEELKAELAALADPVKAAFFPRFFKTGPGQYGEGDQFVGVTVPQQRAIAKRFRDLPLSDVEELIKSPWHEERLVGVFILVGQYKRGEQRTKKEIYDFYMANTKHINNWDIVDSSAAFIVGPWLADKPEKMKVLEKLAKSDLLWDRRISIISTFAYIKAGHAAETLAIAEILLQDKHDLIQKAVGWMLREVGKRVDREILESFLDKHAVEMPRTSLRYALEHLDATAKQNYMAAKDKFLLHG